MLAGPGLAVTLLLGVMGAAKSPGHRLAYICLGNAPGSASQVRVTGYSTFLREEWLAVFHVAPKDFQALATQAKLVPVDGVEIRSMLGQSALKRSRLFHAVPPPNDLMCFKRIFKESEEHQRGGIYAMFDPATSMAAVYREYRD